MLTEIIQDIANVAPLLASYLGGPLSGLLTHLLMSHVGAKDIEEFGAIVKTLDGMDKLIESEKLISSPSTPTHEE